MYLQLPIPEYSRAEFIADIIRHHRLELRQLSRHLLTVIDDLRTVIKPEMDVEVVCEPFSIADLIATVERQTAPLVATNPSMAFEFDTPAWADATYYGDAHRLRVVLTNLLRNAHHHSEGSKVSVEVTRELVDNSHHQIQLTIEDNGKGIALSDIGELFEPFTRGDIRAAGTGVGLHIVKHWVELMGGRVHYTERQGGGSRFEIRLMLEPAVEISAASAVEEFAEYAAQLAGRTMLLVEDDRLMRKLSAN